MMGGYLDKNRRSIGETVQVHSSSTEKFVEMTDSQMRSICGNNQGEGSREMAQLNLHALYWRRTYQCS